MGDDAPIVGKNSRFDLGEVWNGAAPYVSPLWTVLDQETKKGTRPEDTFAGQVAQPGAAQGVDPGAPPSRATASDTAIEEQKDDLARKRASRTLLSGGQGVLDTPSTASTVLLGV